MLEELTNNLLDLPLYFTDANKRIFILYILSALLLTIPVFLQGNQTCNLSNFFKFILPRKIWLHASAKLDYKLWVLNKIIKTLLFLPFILTMVPIALGFSELLTTTFGAREPIILANWLIIAIFTTSLFLLDDFSRFLLHWLLHKVPVLWEFHKVHHSAKVLTPFTIYRTHPIESYLYACRMALIQGLAVGINYYLFGPTLSMFDILGANVFVFIFNIMGSNLRHSHIWLSWGNKIETIFISPAQHQIHHSDDPQHFDRNLGSALAIWDLMFGTLIKASQCHNISFGVGQYDAEHNSIWAIYTKPFIQVSKRLFNKETNKT